MKNLSKIILTLFVVIFCNSSKSNVENNEEVILELLQKVFSDTTLRDGVRAPRHDVISPAIVGPNNIFAPLPQTVLLSQTGNVEGPASSTLNAVPRFADTTGKLLKNSSVIIDDFGNIEIQGITKDGNTVNWPAIVGAAGTFLGSDGSGNLVYATPAGGGNVSAAIPFSTNNAIVTTDTISGSDNVKQSPVTIDSGGNVSNVNVLDALVVSAPTLQGHATSATTADSSTNFTGSLTGDVTGTQNSTVVNSVGGQTAADIAAATITANAATDLNTPNTLVRRNALGNFAANTITAGLIGAASQNVLKSGDTMTGNLNMANQSEVRFGDAMGGEYVGMRAPASVGTSYTVDLPINAPSAGRVLQASSPTTLQWASVGGSPAVTRKYYVELSGNDSNDGSFSAPFKTINHAVSVANGNAASLTPVVINVGTGVFAENNTGGPINITANGISIVGNSVSGTIITPLSTTNTLFNCTTGNVEFNNFTIATAAPTTGNAILLNTSIGLARFNSITIVGPFQNGFAMNAAAGIPGATFTNVLSIGCLNAISINNFQCVIKNSIFQGSLSSPIPVNTGIAITGINSKVYILSSLLRFCNTCITVTGGSVVRIMGTDLDTNKNGVQCFGASNTSLIGCNFLFNASNSVNLYAADASTLVTVEGTHFNCADTSGTPQGTAIQAAADASIDIVACGIIRANVGIHCGMPSDTSTTSILANATVLEGGITDIIQEGSSTLHFVAGVFDANKLVIADPTSISISAFDSTSNQSLSFGSTADKAQELYQILNGQTQPPNLAYQPNYYGAQGTVYTNANGNSTCNATQSNSENSLYYVVTGDRTKQASINLISDTGNIGSGDNVRGWSITKEADDADLVFNYSNNDISGQAERGANNVMQLDGFNNVVAFPASANAPLPTNVVAKLEWAGDTTLYRDSANTLKTDGDLVVGALTPAGVVHNDASGLLSTSLIVDVDISSSAAITDDKLATISTPGKIANSATTAISSNTPNTIVARDGLGDFSAGTITANLSGAASQNVLKSGDTMTGNLNMASQSEIRFQDLAGGEYVGVRSPATVGTSYTVDLPSGAPTIGQVLQATSPTALQWNSVGGSPTVARSYYVSLTGSDSNDGSLSAPFRTVAHAITIANTQASLFNPIVIDIGAGLFVENNSGGPLTITASGITVKGSSTTGTLLIPTSLANNFFNITMPDVTFLQFTLEGGIGSTAQAINVTTTTFGAANFRNLLIHFFQSGITFNSSIVSPFIFCKDLQLISNGTGLVINNSFGVVENCLFQGASSPAGPPANTGIAVTGASSQVVVLGNALRLCTTGISINGGGNLRILGSNFNIQQNGIVCSGSSLTAITGCSFLFNIPTSVNIKAQDTNSRITIDSCNFQCNNLVGIPQGSAIQSIQGGSISVASSTILNANIAIRCGMTGDTSSTEIRATGLVLRDCVTDIQQQGSSTLRYVGGIFELNKVSIADSTNVTFAAFDRASNSSLTLGTTTNTPQELYQVFNGQTNLPHLAYQPNYYGAQGTVYANANGNPTFNATQSNDEDSSYYVVTTDRTKEAGIRLISDTGTVGDEDNVRGWKITKQADDADLVFNYSNSDISGQAERGANNVMQLDGFNNVVAFPASTNAPLPTNVVAKLEWAADTTLYRDSANTLKTDGDLVVGALTPAGVVHNDANGLLSTSLIVDADVSPSAAITDDKLATISIPGKVANSATTATSSNTPNTIVARDGSGDFSAGTITATLSGNATTATTAITSTNFAGSLAGDVTGTQNSTVVSSVGGQSAANVASATLAANAATSTNTANTLVRRDGSGNFAANTIAANLTGNVTGNLTGNATTATSAITSINFTGSLIGDVTGTQNATVVSSVGGQTAANIAAATILTNAATDINTGSAIVRRDASGNFSAGTITADIIGDVTGDVTGNLTGNADTATAALTAGSATNFTGLLAGDATGTQAATVVSSVGGQTAANIATAAALANAATSNNTANTIVRRDSSGNFITNMVTLSGTVSNPTDAATKAYVDTVAALGLEPKTPAQVVSTTNVTLSGLQTIDGVSLSDGDRVLLVGQTDPIENGLWQVHSGAWTRPTDFASGATAGQAYVLIISGTLNGGSSWLCNTTTAIIDTDSITFVQFSLPEQTTGANVGTGAGQIFRDKIGTTLNFKTIAADPHIVVTNNPNDITLVTDATSSNTPNTIVARDGSGNFSASTITANLSGAASQNVLRSGDTMTGNLNMASQSEVRFQDLAGGEYVGLRSPTTVGTSYTVDLPSAAPTIGQVLQATSPTALQWNSVGGSPTVARSYYVSLTGSDSNDGSLSAPFRTVAHAIAIANAQASLFNPIVITIGAGLFVEDNSGGPITITASNITLKGASTPGTLLVPTSLANNFFNITMPDVTFSQFTLEGGIGSTAQAINVTTTTFGAANFSNLLIHLFESGITFNSSIISPFIFCKNLQLISNGTGLVINNSFGAIENCLFQGAISPLGPPANIGIAITGASSQVVILGNALRLCTTGVSINGGGNFRILGSNFDLQQDSIVCSGGSLASIIGCSFLFNIPTSVNVKAQDTNSRITIDSCNFKCADFAGMPQGIALQSTQGASISVASSTILNANIGIHCGMTGDTNSTEIRANGLVLQDCVSDIQQEGSSTLRYVGGIFESNKISISDSTNVTFAAFDGASNSSLTLGTTTDTSQELYQVLNGQTDLPHLTYQPNYYGNKGTVYIDSNSTFNATQSNNENSSYFVITGDRTKEAGIRLISDTGNIGDEDNVRGWNITKQADDADLVFTYSNSDISGQAERGANSVMQLDGFNNIVAFPASTNAPLPTNVVAKLEWAGDTTLYRDSANTLKTDGDVVVGALTPAGVVHNDANGLLSTSLIIDADISPSAAITDDKLATISTPGKVANSATTATSSNIPNTIVARDGSGDFSAGTITANLNGNAITATTAGSTTSFTGSLTGDVTGTQNLTVVSSVGGQSAANVASATLAANAATSTNTANAIVRRDASGNFAASTITANLTGNVTGNLTGNATTATTATSATNFTGSLTGNVTGTQSATVVNSVGGQTAANIAAATVLANAATDINTGSTIVRRDASGNFSAGTITANINGNATSATTAGSTTNFTGSLAGDVTGTQNSTVVSSVGGQLAADVASGVVAANAGTSTNTASTIVRRDASGNFAASTITANVTGNVIGNVTGNLTGNATSATTAGSTTNFTGSLAGDVTGTQAATVVSSVGGQNAANIASGVVAANAATNTNTANAIVRRDGSGNFVANTITANLTGNVTGNLMGNATSATTASSATNFTGSLTGDVTGTQSATIVSSVGGQTATNVAVGTALANAATSTNSPSTIVRRDASGNFAANTITANVTGNLTGNATTATTAGSTTNFTGSLAGDVTGTQTATVVSSVGGQSATNVASGTVAANAATNTNTANAIVRRDGSGNFVANTITASLTGAASLNVLKSGDTMTGALTLPTGTVAVPSLQFSGSTNTGISAPTANNLSLSTNGLERLKIDTTGSVTYKSNYRMYAYRSTDQSVNNTTATIIFDTKLLDPNSNYNTTTGVYTVPATGVYQISISVSAQAGGNNANESIIVVRNGTSVTGTAVAQRQSSSSARGVLSTTVLLALTAADAIRIDYTTDKNDTIIANNSHIGIHYLSF